MLTDAIDKAFDARWDTPPGKDPDRWSPRLRNYHQLLWSKPLPSGELFELDVTTPGAYLHHRSELGEFVLTSDAVMQTFTWWKTMRHITKRLPWAVNESFRTLGYTIGGMMIFPGRRVAGRQTINGARGRHPWIMDRFDLTLECIRRHYCDEPNPLSDTLTRYADFLGLFGDFAGYVHLFHLPDVVNELTSTVKFFTPFRDFGVNVVPSTLDAYLGYRQRSMEFTASRNRRIAAYVSGDRGAKAGHDGTVPPEEAMGPLESLARGLSEGWYRVLLNLGEGRRTAVSFVVPCERRSDGTEREIRELLRADRGWRPQLVGCVAALVAGPHDRPLDALLEAAFQASWVLPQILVTTSLLHPPGWETRVKAAILRRQDSKAAAALAALRPAVAGELAEIASHDRDDGRQIALRWRYSIRAAFDRAGLPHT